jgi:hypothetical protein
MLDGKTYRLPGEIEQELPSNPPRLLNAAAWLRELSALEAEFEPILNRRASSAAERHRQS